MHPERNNDPKFPRLVLTELVDFIDHKEVYGRIKTELGILDVDPDYALISGYAATADRTRTSAAAYTLEEIDTVLTLGGGHDPLDHANLNSALEPGSVPTISVYDSRLLHQPTNEPELYATLDGRPLTEATLLEIEIA